MGNAEETADMSILLQFAKFSKGFRISDFDEFVQKYIGVENLEFFGRLAYPNQWQMRVSKPNIREKLIRMGKTRINHRSCWMYPLNQQEIRGFVHWLPNSVTNDQLMEQLKLYGNVLLIESQKRKIRGRKVESDPRYYCVMLPQGTTKEALPHFLKINGFLCHLAIRGRAPACFHCKEVGHRRAECAKYKAKLISYCNRDPNTTQPRLKPRGRRHVIAEIVVKDQTDGDEVPSSADIVPLEREIPVDAETTGPQSLPVLEIREHITEVQEKATSDTGNELTQAGVLTERTEKSFIGTSAASFSETGSQGIFEILQQIQQRTSEDLRQRFENFGNEIAQTLTSGKFSTNSTDQLQNAVSKVVDAPTNLEQGTSNDEIEKETGISKETFTPVEMPGEESNADKNIKGRKEEEITPYLPTMHQVKEYIAETPEKIINETEEMATDDKPTDFQDFMEKVALILEQTKQTASKTILSTFKILEEAAKSIEESEIPSIESDINTAQKLPKDEMRSELVILEEAKQIASDYLGSTFKKLEEEVASLSIHLANEPTVTNTKVTKEDLDFAFQMLQQAKETVGGTLQNTFRKLTGKLEKEAEPTEIILEISAESKPPSKIAKKSTQSAATLKQRKQKALDIVKQFDKKGMDDVENNEQKSTAAKKQKDTNLSESDAGTISEDYFEATKISESTKKRKKEAVTKKDFSASTGLEPHVSKATLENAYELQKKIREVFISFLAKDELLPETSAILKQVESKVTEVVDKMLNRQ